MLNTQHLGAYVLTEQLRQDTTGTVHRGAHATSNDPVTIRILDQKYGQDPELLARFHRAVGALVRLKHPGIVALLDHGESPEGPYLVTESLTGETLADRLKREQRLPLEETQRIVGAVASALTAAHRVRLVHRDLTADTIFLVPGTDGAPADVKLLDLGLARMLADAPGPNKTAAATRGIDKRADIQALGRLAYQMLSGQVPVEDGDDEAGAEPGRKRPARLSTHGVTVPSAVEAAIVKALERKKKRRFSSMTEFAQAMGAEIELTDLPPPEPESPEPEPEREVTVAAPEPELVVALSEADLGPPERPKPPPLPAAKPAQVTGPIGLVSARVRAIGTALKRPKVAVAAAASVAVVALALVLFRTGDQPGPVAGPASPPAEPAKVAGRVDVARAVPEPPTSAPTKVDEILALNQQAVSAYEQRDFKTARGLLFQADKLAIASGYQDAPVRAQTQVRLGALFVGQKKARLGRPYLARAVAINPAVRIPPGMMSPQIHKTLIATKQKARLAKAGPPKRGAKSQPVRRQGLRKS